MIYTLLTIVLLLILCGRLWAIARDARREAEQWRTDAMQWQRNANKWRSMCQETGQQRDKALNFARSAIDSIAGRQEELDRKDAEIERLSGSCQRLVEQEQEKHRKWVEARDQFQREPVVRRMVETIRRAQDMRPALHRN